MTGTSTSSRCRPAAGARGACPGPPVWIASIADSAVEKVPSGDSNDFNPIWAGDKIYFLSDREGAVSLFAYDLTSKKVSRVFENSGLELKSASAGPGATSPRVPAEKGDPRNLTNTTGTMERDPAWSPDGTTIAFFSDESGEYMLHLKPHDGKGETVKIAPREKPTDYL